MTWWSQRGHKWQYNTANAFCMLSKANTRQRSRQPIRKHARKSMQTRACARIRTHTEKYAIFIAFPRQQRLPERASLLRYMYSACLVKRLHALHITKCNTSWINFWSVMPRIYWVVWWDKDYSTCWTQIWNTSNAKRVKTVCHWWILLPLPPFLADANTWQLRTKWRSVTREVGTNEYWALHVTGTVKRCLIIILTLKLKLLVCQSPWAHGPTMQCQWTHAHVHADMAWSVGRRSTYSSRDMSRQEASFVTPVSAIIP
jgi:hypothetical protein